MSLLGLEAVDREDVLSDRFELPSQRLGVLPPRGAHVLVMPDEPDDGALRQPGAIFIVKFGSDLGDRPVP